MLPPSKSYTLQSLLSASVIHISTNQKIQLIHCLVSAPFLNYRRLVPPFVVFKGFPSSPSASLNLVLGILFRNSPNAFSMCDGGVIAMEYLIDQNCCNCSTTAGKQFSLKNEEAQCPCAHVPGVSGDWCPPLHLHN